MKSAVTHNFANTCLRCGSLSIDLDGELFDDKSHVVMVIIVVIQEAGLQDKATYHVVYLSICVVFTFEAEDLMSCSIGEWTGRKRLCSLFGRWVGHILSCVEEGGCGSNYYVRY